MPGGQAGGGAARAPRRRAVLLPVVTAAAFGLVYALAVRTGAGQRWDAGSFSDVVVLHDAAGGFFRLLRDSLPLLLAVAVVPAGVAVAARAWRRLAAAAVVLAVSATGARVLRDHVLTRPDLGDNGYPQNSFPSGHVAVAAALCVAFVLLWPGGAGRAVVASWGTVAALSAVANVVTFAHRPADVVGSLLLVGTVAAATVQALRPEATPAVAVPWRPRGRPSDEPR